MNGRGAILKAFALVSIAGLGLVVTQAQSAEASPDRSHDSTPADTFEIGESWRPQSRDLSKEERAAYDEELSAIRRVLVAYYDARFAVVRDEREFDDERVWRRVLTETKYPTRSHFMNAVRKMRGDYPVRFPADYDAMHLEVIESHRIRIKRAGIGSSNE